LQQIRSERRQIIGSRCAADGIPPRPRHVLEAAVFSDICEDSRAGASNACSCEMLQLLWTFKIKELVVSGYKEFQVFYSREKAM